MERILIGEQNFIEWLGLRNAATEAYDNTATVVATVRDTAGAKVTGMSSIAMAYVAASDGNYRGTITASSALNLTEGLTYYIEITATGTGNGFRRIAVLADYHSSG